MAPLSPKRRKLDHDSFEEVSASENEENTGDEIKESSGEDETIHDAPAAKRKLPGPKKSQDVDESALYFGGLHKSNMFKLQVDQMLAEERLNYEKRLGGVDQALHRLNSLIEGIESRELLPIAEATKTLHKSHKIIVPYPDPKPEKDAAYKVAYAKPSKVNIVGSYALKTMIKLEGVPAVDMVVVMPESIFQEKDFLNYRYFYKRAYYLACVAAGLQDSDQDEFKFRFEYLNGNSLHPILIAKPKSKDANHESNYEIRIIPTAPEKLFAQSRLRPTKNSIRPKQESESDSVATPLPSPFYNASLKSDCNSEAYLQLSHLASKHANAYKEACILGRIWLRQRGFSSSISEGGFGNFEWTTLTALLLKGGGPKGRNYLSAGYSSYQMFKAMIQYLAASELITKPQSFETVNTSIPRSEFVVPKSDIPMFYDGPRGQNILYKMTPWSYSLLRDEARISVDMLNEATFDQFQSTFIVLTAQSLQRFDFLAQISIPTKVEKSNSCEHKSEMATFSSRLFEVLREGLMDRVKLINIKEPTLPSWSTKSTCPAVPEDSSVQVALVFDSTNVDRLVDHGPSAEEKKKAAKFQKFWGEKAELRRFKDGRIEESLIWSPGSPYSILQEIILYLMKQHFTENVSQSLKFVGDGFEKLLPGSASNTKAFDALREAYTTFEKDVRGLGESLPLQLRQLSPIDPQLRYSSVNLPFFTPRQPMAKPADVLIQFEGSGRWPDDVVAIQRTKIAFLLKIGSLLDDAVDSITTRIGLENEDKPLHNCAFLDVIYPSGAVFRLRIHNDREQTLLERHIKEKSSDYRLREDAVAALSIYKQIFIQLPLLTQSIATHCTRFLLLSPTIRLVKSWFSSHMLSAHISDELIELLVAHTFLQPYPWRAPSSTMAGFLRTLSYIGRWDWRRIPLIVDFTGAMTSTEVATINTRLEAWRKIDPGMNRTVIFAASNHDATGTAFSDNGPSKMVAARMAALARSACKLVKDQGLDLNPKSLFASSTTDYDFVIHLSSKLVTSTSQTTKKPKFKNLEVQSELDLDLVGHTPTKSFIDELEKVYGHTLVLFHGQGEGGVIGGLWNPQYLQGRGFKINLGYAIKPVKGAEEEIRLDKSAILAEFARLGGDMVERIEVH